MNMLRTRFGSTLLAVVLAGMIGLVVIMLQVHTGSDRGSSSSSSSHQYGVHAGATGGGGRARRDIRGTTLKSIHQTLLHERTSNEAMYDYDFTWSIFITPQGFSGLPNRLQRRAIESWIRLKPRPKVVLVGQGEGYEEVAKDYDAIINPHLDMNFVMMPLAGSLIDTAMNADTDVSVILNSDILLTQSFPDAVAKLRTHFDDWFLAGARYDIDDLPSIYEPSRKDFNEAAFVAYTKTKGVLHTAGGQDYFAWNNNGKKLFHGVMPPFIRGKSKFDNWFVHEVIQAGYRDVIDGTEAVTAVHVNHNYKSAEGAVSKMATGGSATFWMKSKTTDWQIFHNNHLAIYYGSYRNQDGTTVHAPWKLAACMEPSGMCLMKRVRPGICPCEHNAFAITTQNDPQVANVFENDVRKNIVKCGSVSVDKTDAYTIPVTTPPGHEPRYGLPFTLKDLLPIVARNKHVILSGVSYIYRDVVMNFVCNLRRLGIYDQLILAAFDEEMYRFGFRMGLPIFYYQSDDLAGLSSRDLEYGSDAFKKVTKLKSQVVLQILQMGYDVTWTDTDIVWFEDPIPKLMAMESDFVVQSNAPFPDERVANGPLRINSGFYRVRSTPVTIAAMQQIVAHAASSTMTEQPSFYIVLCGGKEGTTTVGDNKCHYRPPPDLIPHDQGNALLEVEFLDRRQYPNGNVGGYWNSDNIHVRHPQIVILHNNWIKGLRAKIERLVLRGLWYYDRDREICNYDDTPQFTFNWSVDVEDA
ncbi:hypothetical protein PTSG_05152 [Salpingoeca rosetta]|uniref:Nucleotide-diphospho-sugar transferase domain-containing protein n=1 Tax=Salpingoeca rosetta (strain ATCC 50818 / BSB-021) TaxID=946362 RepID=F2UAN2_SALR5|nr:uncharacterized protein PTSG_05152 [Salpingoeca rosetta]EGD73448.1 hypothetical protein PTSG_05152 [Salpingoeca rosetta]|eukprot:XP_004993730.1 hypothetical protein PTSG_05152 [Salpingoeca rosetta]